MKHSNLLQLMLPLISIAMITASCNSNKNAGKTTDTASNPLLAQSTLPFGAPAFDKIKDADYAPSYNEAIKQNLADIDKVASDTTTPTFENTLVALEKCGQMLSRVN